jgi:hypothetical protein
MTSMNEFRLVLYMNGNDAIDFHGGRAAASPLAFHFHLRKRKQTKVFLGGSFIFQGLGKYWDCIKGQLDDAPKPIKLPKILTTNSGERICVSNKAYIYQNNDPLFTQTEHEVYWQATIDTISNSFTRRERSKFTLPAVAIGQHTPWSQKRKNHDEHWRAIVSQLIRLERPVPKQDCAWKVYGANGHPKNFWAHNDMPSIPHMNAFVHATANEWKQLDNWSETYTIDITDISEYKILNTRIRESLVHELLKLMFASEGWWVNFEVPTGEGRIDFLVKKTIADKHPWTLIEVKLEDNPNAVTQLHTYIMSIQNEVRKPRMNSYFWPLWIGKGRCRAIRGVVLCAAPGTETVEEIRACRYGYDVWTYHIEIRNNALKMVVKDAATHTQIFQASKCAT